MNDLTKGNVLKTLIQFSLPIIGGNLFQLLYSFTDALIVGNILGVGELAGIGATGSLSFLIIGFASGLCSGFSIVTSRLFGAKDDYQLRCAFATSLLLTLILGLLLSVSSVLLLPHLLHLMHTPQDIFHYSLKYMQVIFGGIVITMLYNLLAGYLRSIGDSRTSLYALIMASILNIVLDLLFIGVLSWGVAGAAIATIISQALSALICVLVIARRYKQLIPSRQHYALNNKLFKDLLTQGLSLGFQSSLITMGSIMVQSAINAMGTIYVAANTATGKICQFFLQPLDTIGIALSTFVGQNLGAGRIDRIKAGIRCSNMISAFWSLFSFGCSLLFAPQLLALLITDASPDSALIIREASFYLRVYLLFFLALGPLLLYRNTLQAMGNKTMPMISSFIELAIKLITAIFIAPAVGFTGIVFCDPCAWLICMLLMIFCFHHSFKGQTIQIKP